MMAADLYQTLGVPRNVDTGELKSAYRKLARKYHPDVNPSDEAKGKFQEINNAYEVLSNPETRARYDQFGEAGIKGGMGGGGGGPGVDFDLGDIFESFFGGAGGPRGGGGRRPRGPPQGARLRRAELTLALWSLLPLARALTRTARARLARSSPHARPQARTCASTWRSTSRRRSLAASAQSGLTTSRCARAPRRSPQATRLLKRREPSGHSAEWQRGAGPGRWEAERSTQPQPAHASPAHSPALGFGRVRLQASVAARCARAYFWTRSDVPARRAVARPALTRLSSPPFPCAASTSARLRPPLLLRPPRAQGCTTCAGSGVKPGAKVSTCGTCGGSGVVVQVVSTILGRMQQQAPCPTCGGTGQQVEAYCGSCDGRGVVQKAKTLKVNIPKGVDSGQRLRVRAEGNAAPKGGQPGDLYVFISVQDDKQFRREGVDVYTDLAVTYIDAILGKKLKVLTLDGELEIALPAGTQPGTTLRIEGKGVPRINQPDVRGSQFIKVMVTIPKKLTQQVRPRRPRLGGLRPGLAGATDRRTHPLSPFPCAPGAPAPVARSPASARRSATRWFSWTSSRGKRAEPRACPWSRGRRGPAAGATRARSCAAALARTELGRTRCYRRYVCTTLLQRMRGATLQTDYNSACACWRTPQMLIRKRTRLTSCRQIASCVTRSRRECPATLLLLVIVHRR